MRRVSLEARAVGRGVPDGTGGNQDVLSDFINNPLSGMQLYQAKQEDGFRTFMRVK